MPLPSTAAPRLLAPCQSSDPTLTNRTRGLQPPGTPALRFAEYGPGEAERVRVPLRPLVEGVYVVNWRTVSRVDGDLATESFTFPSERP